MASITDENYLVWNQGKNPLVNFNFMLRVEGLFDLPCKSVHAFSRELEYDYIQEGGLNDYVHMRRKPISKPFTLEVERYVGVDYFDCLPLGADLVLPVFLLVARVPNQFLPLICARTFAFTGCTVMKKTYGELVGDKSGLLTETTTLAYREMLCIDIPWSEVGNNMFATQPAAVSSVTAAETLHAIKQRSQGLYDGIKNAKNEAQAAYNDADAKSKLIPAAITSETTKSNNLKAETDRLENSLPAAQKAAEDASSVSVKMQASLNEKHRKQDEAQRAFGAANQADKQSQSALKDAENAVTAATWKAEALEKSAKDAADALAEANEELTKAKDELSASQKESDSVKSQAESAAKDAEKARAAADDADEKASRAASDADAAEATAEGADPGSPEALSAVKARKTADEAQSAADTADKEASTKQLEAEKQKSRAVQLEKDLAGMNKRNADLEKQVSESKLKSEKLSADVQAAGGIKTEADKALQDAQKAADNTKQQLAEAKTALSAAQTAYDAAKSEADTAKADADTKRTAAAAIEESIKDGKRDYSKSQEILKVLEIASTSTKQRLAETKSHLDAIPNKVSVCETENKAVQKAEALPDAHKHFPSVQSAANDIQKALRAVKATQSYYAHCLSET